MTHWIALAALLLSITLACTSAAQDANKKRRCEPSRVSDASDSHAAAAAQAQPPVRALKIDELVLATQPALPRPMQQQISDSVIQGPYDDNKEGLNHLVDRVRAAFQHHGYFKARAELGEIQTLGENAEARTVAVTVNVAAGRQYRLDEIRFKVFSPGRGVEATASTAQFTDSQLRAFFRIQHGEIFDVGAIQGGITQLRSAYNARGFLNFSLVPSFSLDDARGTIVVLLEIEEGREFHFGRIEVPGVDPGITRHLLASSRLAPGNVFDPSGFAELWKQSETVLPDNLELEEIQRQVNPEQGTVDLTLRVVSCTMP